MNHEALATDLANASRILLNAIQFPSKENTESAMRLGDFVVKASEAVNGTETNQSVLIEAYPWLK